MNRNLLAVASLLAFILALTGCSKNTDSAVVAKVNSGKITAADFKKQLDDLQPQMQQAVSTDPKARKEFLEDLIGIELVLQEAHRSRMPQRTNCSMRCLRKSSWTRSSSRPTMK
jgi:hypothetical protein